MYAKQYMHLWLPVRMSKINSNFDATKMQEAGNHANWEIHIRKYRKLHLDFSASEKHVVCESSDGPKSKSAGCEHPNIMGLQGFMGIIRLLWGITDEMENGHTPAEWWWDSPQTSWVLPSPYLMYPGSVRNKQVQIGVIINQHILSMQIGFCDQCQHIVDSSHIDMIKMMTSF